MFKSRSGLKSKYSYRPVVNFGLTLQYVIRWTLTGLASGA